MQNFEINKKSSTTFPSRESFAILFLRFNIKALEIIPTYLLMLIILTLSTTLVAKDTLQTSHFLQKAQIHFDAKTYDQALTKAESALKALNNQFDTKIAGDCLNLIGRIYLRKRDYQAAFDYFQKALNTRVKVLGEGHPDVANCYNNLGICLKRFGDFEQAIEHYRRALDIRIKHQKQDDIAGSHNNLGNCFLQINLLDSAALHFQKALEYRIAFFGEHDLNVAKSQAALALVLWEKGATFRAKELYLNALSTRKTLLGAEDPSIVGIYDHLGLIAQYHNNLEKAQSFHEQALKIILKTTGEASLQTGQIYNNLGNCYFKKKDFDQALKYYGYAQRVFEPLLHPSDPFLADCLNNFGSCYFEKKDFENALLYFTQALQIVKNNPTSNPEQQAIFLSNIGQIHVVNQNWEIALTHYEAAANLLKQEGKASLHLPKVLTAIGELYLKRSTSEGSKNQALALTQFSEALNLLGKMWANFHDRESLQQLLDNNYEIFENLVATHYALWQATGNKTHLEDIFEIIEKSKSLVWEESFQSKNTPTVFSIPNIAQVQEALLSEDRALLNWFFADSSLFTFVISKNDFFCQSQKLDFSLRESISKMRSGIYNFPIAGAKAARQHNETYIFHATELFDKLLKPALRKLPKNTSKLTLIPDGVLHYLPFDALLVSIPSDPFGFKKFPYLLNHYQSSLAFSASQLFHAHTSSNPKAEETMLSLAPNFEQDPRGFSPLKNSQIEVANIQSILYGTKLIGQDATLENFLKEAPNHRILHLATHGNADDRDGKRSYLAFAYHDESPNDGLLFVEDLNNLSLNAELAVLSACETGIGEYRRGEGVVSLASGISNAGVQSVVTTLWAVSDMASANLVESFFEELKKGISKDEALRQAKLHYLSENTNDKAHPFYWAGFVAMGDMKPMALTNDFWWLVGIGTLLILIIARFFKTKK